MTRQNQALTQRTLAASFQASTFYGTQETNGDEGRFADYRASYSKALLLCPTKVVHRFC